MNKKFSTLVAVLLAAGAWTTLDAKLVEVTAPKVGGVYLLGKEANYSSGEVTGLVNATTLGGTVSLDAGVAISAFGNEWIWEKSENGFYLVFGGQYLGVSGSVDAEFALGTKSDAVEFALSSGNVVVAVLPADLKGSTISEGDVLAVDGTSGTSQQLQAVGLASIPGTNTAIKAVATFEVNKEINLTNFGSQPVNAVAKYNTDDYYFIAQEDGSYLNATNATTVAPVSAGLANLATAGLEAALWKVVELSDVNGVHQYKFVNKLHKDLYAYIGTGATTNTTFSSVDSYNKGFNLTCGATVIGANLASGTAVAVGLYSAPNSVVAADDLNKLLNGGFNLSFKADKDGKITVDYTSAFDGKLKADNETTGAAGKAYQIKSGDDFVVLETATSLTSGIAGAKGKFVKVSEKELTDNASKYLSWFQVTRNAGKATSAVGTLTVAEKSDMADARYAYIPVTSGKDGKTAVLTTIAAANFKVEEAPIITLSASDMVDFKDLLGQFMSISFVKDEAEAENAAQDIVYKRNGILATAQYDATEDAEADYVDKSTVLKDAPEVQWAISYVDEATGKFTLTNRESGKELKEVSFRKTDKAGEWIVESVKDANANGYTGIIGDVVKVKLFDNDDITMFDGFQTYTPNELRNMVFHIGQYHNDTENAIAFWAENHGGKGTHQLGVVADEDKATNWTLRLDQRYEYNTTKENGVVDTIFIETPMATYQKGKLVQGEAGAKDVVVSRLAVLPYQFQNKSNLEYVKYAGAKLNYYVCDEEANVETNANRFALKMKPNGFNIVALSGNGVDGKDSNKPVLVNKLDEVKVYAGNSDEWGNLKKQGSYRPDDNSIMVVTPIDRPEYRKVKAAWGDTVRIYRDEYPTEVLFEKADVKSVVDKDTLSFLNVNNSVIGANPALFVDTAYVNRVDADGVANTCYQYLLAVNVDKANSYYCPYNTEHNSQAWRDEHGGPCADAKENVALKGRFLINLVDTAFAYKQEHLHNNPYINMVEADENLAKLSFVEGIHIKDTLILTRKGGEVVKLQMNDPRFNVAKFAFRYVDNAKGSFKIQTQYKEYKSKDLKEFEETAYAKEGYLRWVNGTVVVTNEYTNGETFNMEENYNGNPTANDVTPEVSAISVATVKGAIIIKGAAGKNVVITNILGQSIANTVITSDEATIAAPAGVAVVAVEGEAAVKAIVK